MPRAPLHLLLVEDQRVDGELIERFLRREPFDVVRARSLAEALERIAQRRPDVGLLDLGLPDSFGLETFTRLHEVAPSLPVVVLSGNADDEIAAAAVRAGAQDYLVKGSFDRRQLLRVLRHAIEREAAEAVSRLRDEKLQTLVRNTPGMIYRTDADLRMTYVCNSDRVHGGGDEALRGRSLLELVHPDQREGAAQDVELLKEAQEPSTQEYPIVTDSGEVRWVEDHRAPLFDDHGNFRGMDGVIFDLTERRRLRIQLARKDRLASIGLLAAGVAHEINNPLTYVLFNLESLADALPTVAEGLERCKAALSGAAGEAALQQALGSAASATGRAPLEDLIAQARDALDGARRIRSVVKSLSTFSDLEEERQVTLSLNQVLEIALETAMNQIRHRARVVKDLGDLPSMVANDGRLAVVFLNLLLNAAEAIGEGDVADNEIRLRTWADGDWVHAEISDTGYGIAEQDLSRLFDPFATLEIGRSSGLGLSICHNIISAHGGTIDVESAIGAGSRFTVSLPVRFGKAEPTGDVPSAKAPAASPGVARVLVVDDDAQVARAIASMLGGYEVVTVGSGAAAKQLLAEGARFDAIISDLLMPNVTGMDLHQWIEQNHPPLADRMIFVTGAAFTERARAFLDRVANPRLAKPFEKRALEAWLRKLTNQS